MMPSVHSPLTPEEVLANEWLAMRASVLDLAASLDRIERVSDASLDQLPEEARLHAEQIRQAVQILLEAPQAGRAEQVQQLFSRPYDASWLASWLEAQGRR